jgi:Zn-dependent peptidase ImmA (M78 family)/DNA-binding XRE family transcriptional regulator
MRPGTHGFSGGRLLEAREARGIPAAQLAGVIGVSRQAVSQYEHGLQSPSPETMARIGVALDLPITFFLRDEGLAPAAAIFYRSLSSATKQARRASERRFGWLRDAVAFLQEFVDFPAINLPQRQYAGGFERLSDDDVEQIATEARRFWGLGDGPITNVVWLLENNGIVVSRQLLRAAELDAFSHYDERPYVVLGDDKRCAVRSRFDAAHELAHLLLHQKVTTEQLTQADVFRKVEDQANRFASAFLLPKQSFFEVARRGLSLEALRSAKEKWRVAISCMIMRASQLGLLNEYRQQRLWINYSRRKWRRQEPLDDRLEPEQPRLLKRSCELIVSNGVVSKQDFSARLYLPNHDVEELLGLPSGFFHEGDAGLRLRT